MYVIINSSGTKLSGFYPNQPTGQLAFRKRDYMIFSTKNEAERQLRYIQRHKVGKNLRVVKK